MNSSPQGDGFTLILLADPAQIVVAAPAFDPGDITSEISALHVRDAGADLATTLDLARQNIVQVRDEYPRLRKHRVYFLSDLGANTWQATATQRVREQIAELESMAEIVTIDVGTDDTSNAGISNVARAEPVATLAREVHWRVTLRDHVGLSPETATVEMLVDGRRVESRPIELPRSGQATTSFAYQFDTNGQHRVEFHLTDDALPIDNHWYEVLNVQESRQVLCVSGKPGSSRNVAVALSPSPDDPTIQTKIVADHRLTDLDLSEFECIFFCNVARFTADMASMLQDYLHLGRGVVMFLGDPKFETVPETAGSLTRWRQREFGDTVVSIMRYAAATVHGGEAAAATDGGDANEDDR